jgi:hypothetical protein
MRRALSNWVSLCWVAQTRWTSVSMLLLVLLLLFALLLLFTFVQLEDGDRSSCSLLFTLL